MNRKLTLSLDSKVIEFAHDFSKKAKKPIPKEPVPKLIDCALKAHGFGPGYKSKAAFPKLKFWESLKKHGHCT
jgi:hypothetical protein